MHSAYSKVLAEHYIRTCYVCSKESYNGLQYTKLEQL
jgi:hypothetical protein